MKNCTRIVSIAFIFLTAFIYLQEVFAGGIKYVRTGKLIEPSTGIVLQNQLIRIENERIVSISPWKTAPLDGPIIDWSQYTVLPGLIDMHVHLADAEQTANVAEPLLHSVADIAYIGAANALKTLEAGFTTVHDVGTFRAFSDVALRNAINKGLVPGPRMNVVGAYIQASGGGGEVTSGLAPDIQVPADMRVGVVAGPQDTRLKVSFLLNRGADSIKLIATGAVLVAGGGIGIQELTDEEMKAAADTAKSRGSWVTAHANSAEGIKAAIRAGVNAIEHASLIDDEGIELAKQKGVYLDMDIYNGDFIEEVGTRDGWNADMLRKNRETTTAQREGFRKAVQAGIKLTYGTDAGVFPHGLNARQFKYMVRYGMTPMQAIQAATIHAAALLGWSKDVGSLTPGHFADMIAVTGDPLKDISLLENVKGVIKGGQVVHLSHKQDALIVEENKNTLEGKKGIYKDSAPILP